MPEGRKPLEHPDNHAGHTKRKHATSNGSAAKVHFIFLAQTELIGVAGVLSLQRLGSHPMLLPITTMMSNNHSQCCHTTMLLPITTNAVKQAQTILSTNHNQSCQPMLSTNRTQGVVGRLGSPQFWTEKITDNWRQVVAQVTCSVRWEKWSVPFV